MLLRERETPEGTLVSVCDAECLGETYENDTAEITVEESFYGGPEAIEADSAAVVDALHRAQVGNIVGTEAVDVAIDAGIVDEAAVLEFDGTRHAQLLWL